MRMICPNCNMEIDNDSNFCKYCGTKVMKANVCPKCGAEHLPNDAKFCPDCGFALGEESNYSKAESIVSMYNKGFKYYVRTGSLRNLTTFTSEEYINKIIDWEDKIRIKHFEL